MKSIMGSFQQEPKETTHLQGDTENDLYLFEAFLNDYIENEILRIMECCNEKSNIRTTPLSKVTLNQ